MEKCKDILVGLPYEQYKGIDPGESGALATVDKRGGELLVYWKPTEGFEGYKKHLAGGSCRVKLFVERERVSMLMSPGAATTFMTGYGFCLGVCYCLGVEPKLYDPQEWMKILGLKALLANPDGSKPTAAQKKRHHTLQIRALWGDYVKDVPDYAIDAYGILLAGLIDLKKGKV